MADQSAMETEYNDRQTTEFRTSYEYAFLDFFFFSFLKYILVVSLIHTFDVNFRYSCEQSGQVMQFSDGTSIDTASLQCQWDETWDISNIPQSLWGSAQCVCKLSFFSKIKSRM